MYSIKELREQQYKDHIERMPYYKHWKSAPYTWVKGRFYMESSAVLVWLLLKTKIKPNTITVIYGFSGIACMFFLAIPTNLTIIMALIIAFSKGVLDWSDGHYARITNQTSLTGVILDIYGASLNEIGFYAGFGFYVAAKNEEIYYFYLIPILLFLMGTRLTIFAASVLFEKIDSKSVVNDVINGSIYNGYKTVPNEATFKAKLENVLKQFLNARSRSIDFVCFIILLELVFLRINITWVIFILLITKHLIIFFGSIYIFWKGGWAENKINNKILSLQTIFSELNEDTNVQ
jgi:phosphatidylglycerophosphate synthase